MKNITVTIGIPTCYGGKSLVKAVESVWRSQNAQPFKINDLEACSAGTDPVPAAASCAAPLHRFCA